MVGYEGGLQGVGNGQAIGWAWNPRDPGARVAVTIALDGEVVAEGVAALERPDLAAAGKGDGAHGFVIDLPVITGAARHGILALAGPELAAINVSPSFWHEAAADSPWAGVAFHPGERLGAPVAAPPAMGARRAVLAPGGWLFDAEDFDRSSTPETGQVEELAARIEATSTMLAELGVHYLPAVIAPKALLCGGLIESPSAHPDAPESVEDTAAPAAAGQSWLQALRQRLRDSDRVELFSLVEPLRDAGRRVSCYHRTDADWNDAGAFFAARAIAKELAKRLPNLRPPTAEDLHLLQVPDFRGSLAEAALYELREDVLVAVQSSVEPEAGVAFDPRRRRALRMPLDDHLAGADGVHTRLYVQAEDVRRAGSEGIRLAVIGDGAALAPLAWLADCAERTTFWWSSMPDLRALELELPHAVIHLIRMRELPTLLRGAYGLLP